MALKASSRASYSSLQRVYLDFCGRYGVDPFDRRSDEELAWAAAVYANTHKVTTLPQYVSAMADWHRELGLGELARGNAFAQTKKGLSNCFGVTDFVERKRGFSMEDLLALRRQLPEDLSSSAEGAAFWCMCVFAFFGLLRIGEYADGALKCGDVVKSAKGIELTVAFSKTKPRPQLLRLAARSDELCPVRAFEAYVAHFGRRTRRREDPFFVVPGRRKSVLSVSSGAFSKWLKAAAGRALGWSADEVAGHSFRRGGATAMWRAGISEAEIKAHGRWESDAYKQYLDFEHAGEAQWRPTQVLAKFEFGEPSSPLKSQ
jgi:integrase